MRGARAAAIVVPTTVAYAQDTSPPATSKGEGDLHPRFDASFGTDRRVVMGQSPSGAALAPGLARAREQPQLPR
jgi:hypothetical protein